MQKLCKDQNIKNLIVTMGTQGSIFYNKNKNNFILNEAYSKNAVDKIGAGDAMLAISSLCLLKKFPERLSLIIGSLAAALSVKSIGNKMSINKVDILKSLEHMFK